jgi:hypothetical protein
LAWFAAFFVAAIVFTWPLAIRLETSVADAGDPLLNAWILDWTCHALSHDPLNLFNAPIYHPGLFPLAYSEHLAGIALVVLPFHLAGLSPLTVYNIAMLLGFAFSAYAAFVLARLVTGSSIGALAGALFFAFGSFAVMHISHLQVVWSGWLPMLLAALLYWWREPSWKRAALLGAAFTMNGLTNIYWLLYGGFALVVTMVLLHWSAPRRWKQLIVALAVASAILLPFLIPYQMVSKEYGAGRTSFEARLGSASLLDWAMPSPNNWIYGGLPPHEMQRAERQLFPGIAVLALIAIAFFTRPRGERFMRVERNNRGLDVTIGVLVVIAIASALAGRVELGPIRFSGYDVPAVLATVLLAIRLHRTYPDALAKSRFSREEWSAFLWIAIGFVASLGWNAFLHPFLFRVVTPFRATRTPARWAVIAGVGLAVWAAIGIAALLAKKTTRARSIAALLVVFVTLEAIPDVRWDQFRAEPAPVYRWLARERPGVVLELPLVNDGSHFRSVFFNSAHRQPIVNGTSGWETPLHESLRKAELAQRFDDAFLTQVETAGTKIVIVHADDLGHYEAAVKAFLRAQLASGRLTFLRRFDHEVNGDYVFAIGPSTLRAPEVPDGAGFLPAQNLERWLSGQATYSDAITVVLESPHGDVGGPLTVRGYAFSPHIIRGVTVLVEQGTRRYEAKLVERPDVAQRFPWYRHSAPRPGFELAFDERPDGIPERTDVQVEVVDNAGRVMRSRDFVFNWRAR